MVSAINKDFIVKLSIILVAVLLVIIGWILLQKRGVIPELDEEAAEEETTKELLQRLTPEDAQPLTEEEQRELDELLLELTPSQQNPMSEEEKQGLEELLNQLTP